MKIHIPLKRIDAIACIGIVLIAISLTIVFYSLTVSAIEKRNSKKLR